MAKNQQSNVERAPHVVSGKIANAAGKAIQGLNVRAFERRLRAEHELGRAITDLEGHYRIEYRIPEPLPGGKQGVDLVVKAFHGKDPEPILVSRVVFSAGQSEQVDLTLPAAQTASRSEYEELVETLNPALAGVNPAGLSDDELQFLAGNTGAAHQRISLLRQSAKIAAETGIPVEVFYALARQGMVIDDPARLPHRPLPALRRALATAITDRVLPDGYRDQLDAVMERLGARALDEVLRPEIKPGRIPVGALLGTSRLSPAAKERLVATALEDDGTRRDFWQRLAETPEFADRDQIDEARTTLQVGVLTGYHLPLVRALQSMRADGRLGTLKDLARWDEQQWLDLVRETGAPAGLDGVAEETRDENYASALFRQVELAFPTTAIAAQLARSALPERNELGSFFADHSDFDLLTDSVERRFGPDLTAPVRDGLKRLQRLARVTPRFRQIEILMKAGFTSAQKIGAMSEGAFVARMGTTVGSKRECRAVYRKAAQRKDLVLNLRTRYGGEQDVYRFRAIPPASPTAMEAAAAGAAVSMPGSPQDSQVVGGTVTPAAPDRPIDWTALFGSPDMCDCPPCRSVLSPAAYFVDLLQFLKKETPDGVGLSTLLATGRRWDLQYILLNCENTDTPLPYVDLVNEVLENAVAGHPHIAGDPCAQTHQTTWSQEELASNPEHVSRLAYDKLRERIFPLSLPLDLDAEEARVYLRHLGTSRHALMEAFYPRTDPLDDSDIAAEFLGLTTREWRLIEGDDGSAPWALWGLGESNWLDVLSRPRELMRRAGVTFTELMELLGLAFVNKAGLVRISYGASLWAHIEAYAGTDTLAADCQLDNALINVGEDPQVLSRLCRFVRLWRRLGWSMRDLDTTLLALGGGVAGHGIPLLAMSHVQRLHERLGLPISTLAAFFGPLSTRPGFSTRPGAKGEPSQYERIFLTKSGLHPSQDDQREVFEVNNLGHGNDLREHLPHAAAALGTSAEQLLVLVEWLQGMGARPLAVDLASLSTLYRLTRLARVLGLRARELTALLELHGIGPAAPASEDPLKPFLPMEVFALLDGADRLKASGFAVEELDYLLRHRFAVPAKAEESLRQRAVILEDLRIGLRKIANEQALPQVTGGDSEPPLSDARGELLRRKLTHFLHPDKVEAAMRWARGEFPITGKAAQGLLQALPHRLLGPSGIDLWEADGRFADTSDLRGNARAAKEQANYDYLLRFVTPLLRDLLSRSFIKQQLAAALSLDAMLAERLLEKWVLAAEPHPTRKAIDVFLETAFAEADSPLVVESYTEQQEKEADFRVQFRTLLRLQKVASVLTRLNIDAHQASYLFSETPTGWLDPRELPLEPAVELTKPQALYRGWQRLADLCALRNRIGAAEPSLFDLFELARRRGARGNPDLFNVIEERVSWTRNDVTALCTRFGYVETNFRDERAYLRLERCFRLAQRIGVAISEPPSSEGGSNAIPNILAWLQAEPLAPVARGIKLAARSRYPDEEAWATVARPLQDQIRERKRAALVDWLITSWGWQVEDLYAHYLIDPEMSACMLTSRIKQAISSVQLFIQRIFLGIEHIAAEQPLKFNSDEAKEQWEWMKNYRVWEVNRKIFLFPENWIEPELRDDKSPFFKELESELRQSALTSESIEKAYLHYLTKLEAVSNLEIMAHCYSEQYDRLHVFGRTRSLPRTWYYRSNDRGLVWTPWERVPSDIQSDHILPVIWHNRLHVFWPIFEEAPAPRSWNCHPDGTRTRSPALNPKWTIRLAWAKRDTDSWTTSQSSNHVMDDATAYIYDYDDCRVGKPDKQGSAVVVAYHSWRRGLIGAVQRESLLDLLSPCFASNNALFHFEISEHETGLRISVYYPCISGTWSDKEQSIVNWDNNGVGRSLVGDFLVNLNSLAWVPCNSAESDGPIWETVAARAASSDADGIPIQAQRLMGYGNPGYRARMDGQPWPSSSGFAELSTRLWENPEPDAVFTITPSNHPSFMSTSLSDVQALFISDSKRTFWLPYRALHMFYHPFLREIFEELHEGGVAGILAPAGRLKEV